MIINGGSRSNWRFFSQHLMKAEENERVEIMDIRGLVAENVLEAFREMRDWADFSGGRCKNFFYHANINPREGEVLTPEQWEQATDTLETNLGLAGHSRFIVEHEKDGRTHRHVVWLRIDPETMTAASDSNDYAAHQRTSRALESAFGHEPVQSVFDREAGTPRPERRPKNWETFRGHQSGIDPHAMKAELTQLWNRADSGKAFTAALDEQGYILAKGDRRDFVVIDPAGDAHSLARRIEGVKAKDICERMADVEREALPSTQEAAALAKTRATLGTVQAVELSAVVTAPTEPTEPAALPVGAGDPRRGTPRTPETLAHSAGQEQVRAPLTPAAALDAFASSVKHAMRSNGGQLPMRDSLTWWERTVAVVTAASLTIKAFTWVKGAWDVLIEQFHGGATPEQDDHAHGHDWER
jgi:hypothetical protein